MSALLDMIRSLRQADADADAVDRSDLTKKVLENQPLTRQEGAALDAILREVNGKTRGLPSDIRGELAANRMG